MQARFSPSPREATLTSETFALRETDNDDTVAGEASLDGAAVAVFSPAASLALITSYEASLSTDIEGVSGEALAGPYRWSFKTRDGVWGTPEMLEIDDTGELDPARVAFDREGNAFVVWQQSDGLHTNIWASRYEPGNGWSKRELLESRTGDAVGPVLAVRPAGNAVCAWRQAEGSRFDVWANHYTPGEGWGLAERVEASSAGSASSSEIGIDSNGNAIAVWTRSDGGRRNAWANRFTPTGGWGTPQLIDSGDQDATGAQVAMDPAGRALAVWDQRDVGIGL